MGQPWLPYLPDLLAAPAVPSQAKNEVVQPAELYNLPARISSASFLHLTCALRNSLQSPFTSPGCRSIGFSRTRHWLIRTRHAQSRRELLVSIAQPGNTEPFAGMLVHQHAQDGHTEHVCSIGLRGSLTSAAGLASSNGLAGREREADRSRAARRSARVHSAAMSSKTALFRNLSSNSQCVWQINNNKP